MKVRSAQVEIYGHRGLGAHGAKPANTIPAFEEALRSADGIETDLRLSKDGSTIFLSHDEHVRGGAGGELSVHASSVDALKHAVMSADDGSTAPLATVDELLVLLEKPELAGKKAILELKAPPKEAGDPAEYAQRLLKALVAAIERHPVGDRLMISSFDVGLLKAAKEAAPHLPRYLLTTTKAPLGRQLARAKDLELTGVHAGTEKGLFRFPPSDRALRKLDAKFEGHVGTWTVNSPEAALHQAANGVTQVLTDEPAAVRDAFERD